MKRLSRFARSKAVRDFVAASRNYARDDMATYASALAFRIILSLFPFLAVLLAIVGFLEFPALFSWLHRQAELLLPASILPEVNAALGELQVPQHGLLSSSIAIALWIASSAARATMHALNIAYAADEERPPWKRIPLSIGYTVAIAALLLASAALLLAGPVVMRQIAHYTGMEEWFELAWLALRWPAAILLMVLGLALIYQWAPNVEQRMRLFSPGAVFAVAIWICLSLLFDLYVQNFARYSVTYGSVGAAIALLLYIYISSAVLLFGAEINALPRRRSRHDDA